MDLNPQFVHDLLLETLVTKAMKTFHAVSHFKHETFTVLTYIVTDCCKGQTIRNPWRGRKKLSVHQFFFSQSWLQEFFPMWKVHCFEWCTACTNFIFLKNFPCRNSFFWGGGDCHLLPPPPRPLRDF